MKPPSENAIENAIALKEELLCQVDIAIEAIRTHEPSDKEIHRARKRLKRARAVLGCYAMRLVKRHIGEKMPHCEMMHGH